MKSNFELAVILSVLLVMFIICIVACLFSRKEDRQFPKSAKGYKLRLGGVEKD